MAGIPDNTYILTIDNWPSWTNVNFIIVLPTLHQHNLLHPTFINLMFVNPSEILVPMSHITMPMSPITMPMIMGMPKSH